MKKKKMKDRTPDPIAGIAQITLFDHALRLTKKRDDAHDLVQDTMLKAARFYNNFQEGTNLYGWLFIIMKNTFINRYRRKSMESNLIVQVESLARTDLYLGSVQNEGPGKFIISDVRKAMEQIPKEYANAFQRSFEGYKYAEIARELKIPIGTVKTRIYYARELLKKYLKQYRQV